MTVNGMLTCGTFAGATDTDLFVGFVRDFLSPRLKSGQVVVMDNLAVHKAAAVGPLIEAAGCRLMYLPPYSPDLNPIEMAISKMKSTLRTLEARTIPALIEGIGLAMESITATDVLHFTRHCGYRDTCEGKLL